MGQLVSQALHELSTLLGREDCLVSQTVRGIGINRVCPCSETKHSHQCCHRLDHRSRLGCQCSSSLFFSLPSGIRCFCSCSCSCIRCSRCCCFSRESARHSTLTRGLPPRPKHLNSLSNLSQLLICQSRSSYGTGSSGSSSSSRSKATTATAKASNNFLQHTLRRIPRSTHQPTPPLGFKPLLINIPRASRWQGIVHMHCRVDDMFRQVPCQGVEIRDQDMATDAERKLPGV
ncbi:hypothetical protein K457DRAFT_229790 [Linnemannia elongata AG-77]|uniref:Uncharacterized protein n=1 Tax=Linnemannia elongata AG-77 TaxID=1314771 RepID=A0A197KAQ9_9FUNG|nr:hypothetical protein K457DRAFT_229790 [Linnemannia elongata AG-77]